MVHKVATRMAVALPLALVFLLGSAQAQYKRTNLVSNQAGKAAHQDTSLVNAWGVAFTATGPLWVSDNVTGLSTLYTGKGIKQSLVVTIPPAPGGAKTGSPTGIVANTTSSFVVKGSSGSGPAQFIFATLDGTISGWSPAANPNTAIIAVNKSSVGAVYTGLAMASTSSGNFLYAADTVNNHVDQYDGNFNFVRSFTDSTVPAGFTPYGIGNVSGKIFVTYASSSGGSGGVVDEFDTNGKLLKTFTKNSPLNQPWGLALAPSNFGQFSNAMLISNNTPTGTINAFNASTGKFLGTLKGTNNKNIQIDQLWSLTFGLGGAQNGQKNQLFFSSGPSNYANGLIGVIQP